MMFNKVFIEKDILQQEQTQQILAQVKYNEFVPIQKVEDYFGQFKKPYLQKRQDLNLYLGQKKGQLVKEAPDAYGVLGQRHFYFIHTYNCIYECEYCYLQGYFNNPDIVLYLNHKDIEKEISKTIEKHADEKIWFHAGEFSDSLALSHITKECDFYWRVFSQHPQVKLELRTKSANIRELLKKPPLENIIVTYSLSPEQIIKDYEHKTPRLKQRLGALKKLQEKGFKVALHFDPIIYTDSFLEDYAELLNLLTKNIMLPEVEYLSLGVVRFTKDVYTQVEKNYPNSALLAQEFIKSFDDKIRYNRPTRSWILKKVKNLAIQYGLPEEKAYLCME